MIDHLIEEEIMFAESGTLILKTDKTAPEGLVKATILATQSMIPFFSIRVDKDEKGKNDKNAEVLMPLCFTCAIEKRQGPCFHSKIKRRLTVSCTIAFLNYALEEKKCSLDKLLELWIFEKSGMIFKSFIECIGHLKEEFDNTDKKKSKIVKKGLNQAFGRFMMRPKDEENIICTSYLEFSRLVSQRSITGIQGISQGMIDVTVKVNPNTNTHPDLLTNVPIGAHILGYARMLLDKKWKEIKTKIPSAKPLMINSDAIAFTHDNRDSFEHLKLSREIGGLKNEIPDARYLIDFFALHPRAYQISYEKYNGTYNQLLKLSGFQMNNHLAAPVRDCLHFDEMVSKAMQEIKDSIPVDQIRCSSDLDTGLKKHSFFKFYLKNTVSKKRALLSTMVTLPFGYSNDLRNEVENDQ